MPAADMEATKASMESIPAGMNSGRRGWRWDEEVRGGRSFLLLYLAVGLLLAEAAVGIVLVGPGAALLRPGASTPVAAVPNGPPVSVELRAYLTGFSGVGGSYAGVRDPTIVVGWGDHVTLSVVDGEAMVHNLHVDGYDLQTRNLVGVGDMANLTFQATVQGSFAYYCAIPGHRAAGMSGLLVVGNRSGPVIGPEMPLTTGRIAHDPTDLPGPLERNASASVDLYLHAVDETAEIEPGVSYTYWTFNGTVPGPFFRVRQGDSVTVHFSNDRNNTMNHSVDFHAVTGPGGGASVTQTPPGGERNFTFLAMTSGLFVYHCGTPNIPTHIANGMFGLILVEPPGGLPPVDHELYLMESELYLGWPLHTMGGQIFNGTALLENEPTYVVFNGAFDAFTGAHALHAAVNDSVRIFFGEAGPNDYSAFHMIGSMFDTTYLYGDLTDPPAANLQTVPVPPGSAAMMEFTAKYPGNYPLIDHQIVNAMDKGALAVLNVTGYADGSIFHPDVVTSGLPTLPAGPGGPAARSVRL